jgi:hypothetical protein
MMQTLAAAQVHDMAGASAPAVAAPSPVDASEQEVEVMALAECLIAGVRRQPGERFVVPASRVAPLAAVGYVMPDEFVNRMPPEAAALWRERATQQACLTSASLAVDDATVDALWYESARRVLSPDGIESHYDPAPIDRAARPLRVLQMTQYDPGSSVYRYHSAANSVPGVVSAMVRWGHSNPHCDLRQWDGHLHQRTVDALAMTADVLHVHMDYRTIEHDLKMFPQPWQRVAITYHGSVLPGDTGRVLVDHEADTRWNAIRFGARPYHGRFGVERYLPIPMPVEDYAMLAAGHDRWQGPRSGRKFRVAHSPTRREIKGSNEFEAAVDYLAVHEGLPIEAVMIQNMEHGAALQLKATCDATFDSFWLGMQGSGLEAASMGQAVIAGDHDAAGEAADLNGGLVPWTFANDQDTLRDRLRRMVTCPDYWADEVVKVHQYVCEWHDYRAVGDRYRHFLEEALGRGPAER